jgi:anti-sigma regulatory factor (Ser/Thr protein kinase)
MRHPSPRSKGTVKQLPSSGLFLRLPPDTSSPARAREQAHEHLVGLGIDGVAADVALIVSELVTNAVLHAEPPIEMTLHVGRRHIRIEVCDGGTNPTAVAAHPLADTGGAPARGLHIVEELSSRWGTARRGNGKVVWAEISRP